MSYLVLARKYRPRTFAEVAGQSNVTRVLRGAIREGRIAHSYLFTGPRGTGKTTSARLLAKAINCEQGPAEEPCGTCERCLALDAGSEMDVIEINEAFAVQVLGCVQQLGLSADDPRLNANGGAIAIGHPLGASGARLALTALRQLEATGGRYALVTMCIGVGQGIATIIERLDS